MTWKIFFKEIKQTTGEELFFFSTDENRKPFSLLFPEWFSSFTCQMFFCWSLCLYPFLFYGSSKKLFAPLLLFLNLFFPYRLCQSLRENPNESTRVGNGEYWKVHFGYQDYKELDFIILVPVTFISKAFYYAPWYVLSW